MYTPKLTRAVVVKAYPRLNYVQISDLIKGFHLLGVDWAEPVDVLTKLNVTRSATVSRFRQSSDNSVVPPYCAKCAGNTLIKRLFPM